MPVARWAARFWDTVTFSLSGSSVSCMPKVWWREAWAAAKIDLKRRWLCGAITEEG